ncbi:LysR family transcriptional regulator [Mycetocola reblochoni]|uniref:LysR-family transcriptional regulator n=2 Tax=Mycetocola reblochoni TaxID=331618 RepID=A0A1R4IUJ7_9MICO|nr:LysR family transcriptional regulator [Mycetocola reblochoni]RLP71022.1 LysR family transcriptional regulator [Mycetocola reblochoni]SJN23551.1 LysR-family transcriptional regulator [Mycetocola reblochoni REB411]
MDLDPKRLSFLLAVARHGSILAAADFLHLTPSAVSQQVSRLEREEGVDLLDRGPRGVSLTPAGRILVEVAENIERELTEARSRLSESQDTLTGTVVIGAFQTVISGLLAPILPELDAELPGISIVIAEGTTERMPQLLRSGEANLIIVDRDLAPTPPAYTAEVPLLDEPWRLVAPTASTADPSITEIGKLPWLGASRRAAAAPAVERAIDALGITPVTTHRYDDYQSALSLVRAGQGVTLLPALALKDGVPEGVDVIDMAGLGSRHLTIRHRATRREPGGPTRAVLDSLLRLTREYELVE